MAKAHTQPLPTLRSSQFAQVLPLIWLWQLLFGLAATGLGALLLVRADLLALPDLARIGAAVLLLAAGLFSLGSIIWLQRRDHRGRVVVLVTNYLAALVALFYAMHRLGIFLGIDDLAGTFAYGLPFLLGVLGGYLVNSLADRYPNNPARARNFQRLGRLLMLVFGVGALIAVGLFTGLQAILMRIATDRIGLLAVVALLVFGLITWLMWREEAASYYGATVAQNEMLNGYLLLSPNLLGFLIFFAGPLLFSLYVSFTSWSAFGDKEWVGFGNYLEIVSLTVQPLAAPGQRASEVLPAAYSELTRISLFGQHVIVGARDNLFWIALRNTLLYTALVVPLSVIPALVLSNILNSKIPGMRFFRAIYFLPSVAAIVGVAVIWSWLYNSTTGFINYGVSTLVTWINYLPGTDIADPKLTWLSNSRTALLSIVLMSAWRIVGFNTVLFLAGLQGISTEIYEAADVDGASSWRKFMSITIPLLAPTTFFVVTTTMIQALQIFDEVFVLINPPQGPSNSTLTAVLYLYQNGFQRFRLGYASAIAWVFFLVIFAVTLVQFRVQRSTADD